METIGQVMIHRVSLAGPGSSTSPDQKSAWPSVWVSGEVGRESRKPTAPASVRVLVANADAPFSLRMQASSNPDAPNVIVTPGADGSPGWLHVRVGDPLVLVNDRFSAANNVTLLLQY